MQPALVPGVALTAVGLGLGWSFTRDLYFGLASRTWRKANGWIVGWGGHGGSVHRDDSAGVLTYTYVVNGVEYTSNRYDFAGRNVGAGAGVVLADHSIGEGITVWYDPHEPGRAVLVQGALRSNYLRLFIATVFLLLGLLFLFVVASDDGSSDPAKPRLLSRAEIDSLRRLPTTVDTFIANQTHVELRVGDTLWLSALFAEARDSTGHALPGVGPTFNLPRTAVLRSFARGMQAVAPGRASVFIEDRPRDFATDSMPRRPSTRVEIDVRR